MAFGIFLNFEKVAINIIEEQLKKMTNDNIYHYDDECEDDINEEEFVKNLQYGSTTIAFIQNLFETSINTILRRRAEISEIDLLKSSIGVKLQIISLIYEFDLDEIKAQYAYQVYREVEKIRNDITHFKSNILCEAIYQGVFEKNLQKFCCYAGIRLLPFTFSMVESHFVPSSKRFLHLTHGWRSFCQPIRREILLQSLTATFAAEKRHDF